MRRWAVFHLIEEFKTGGMNDFLEAFDTEKEAEAYLLRNPYPELDVVDMWTYLGKPEGQ